jgi:hypothetical protein
MMVGTYDGATATVQPDDVTSPVPVPVYWRDGIQDGDRISYDLIGGVAVNVGIVRARPRSQLRDWSRR